MVIGKQVKANLHYTISHILNNTIDTYTNLDISLAYWQGYLRVNAVVWVLTNTISQKYTI